MAKGKSGRNDKKCQRYLNEKRRIKNKTKDLEVYIEKHKKETSKENIKRSCRIGRRKEGFEQESFKRKKKTETVV